MKQFRKMQPMGFMILPRGRWFAVMLLASFVVTSIPVRAQTNPRGPGVTVADDAAGGTVHLRNGQALTVRLAANATTGYRWSVRSGTGGCLELTSNTYWENRSPGLGRGGTAVFVFRARRAGRTVLRLGYSRPFERHVPPVRVYVLTVVVRGGST